MHRRPHGQNGNNGTHTGSHYSAAVWIKPPRAGGSFVIAFASGEHPQFPLCRAESFIRTLVEIVALEEVCEKYAKAPLSHGTPFPPVDSSSPYLSPSVLLVI